MIIHGIDRFGRIEAVDGEYLVTRFHHVFLMPLVPIGSEWVMLEDRFGLHGRPCRLSGRSVLAAYLRTWGAVGATVLFVAGAGSSVAVALGSLLATLSLVSLMGRGRCDWRECERAALQRPVLGTALDPVRLPRDTAAHLLPAAEERFAAVSGGHTALEVSRLGASSPAQAAHAFVVLRLIASVGGSHAAHALDASNRILENRANAVGAGDPYRAAWRPAAAPTVPLLDPFPLRPHRWYGVIATVSLFAGCVVYAASQGPVLRVCGESKVDIARSVTKKLAFEAYSQWRMKHPDVPCPTDSDLGEYVATAKPRDPWGNPYRIRCDDLPDGAVGIAVWSIGVNFRDEWGAGDDHASWR